jgi:hypothetical protein
MREGQARGCAAWHCVLAYLFASVYSLICNRLGSGRIRVTQEGGKGGLGVVLPGCVRLLFLLRVRQFDSLRECWS